MQHMYVCYDLFGSDRDRYIYMASKTDGICVDGMCKAGVLGYLFLFLLVVS